MFRSPYLMALPVFALSSRLFLPVISSKYLCLVFCILLLCFTFYIVFILFHYILAHSFNPLLEVEHKTRSKQPQHVWRWPSAEPCRQYRCLFHLYNPWKPCLVYSVGCVLFFQTPLAPTILCPIFFCFPRLTLTWDPRQEINLCPTWPGWPGSGNWIAQRLRVEPKKTHTQHSCIIHTHTR